jgi:DNA primase
MVFVVGLLFANVPIPHAYQEVDREIKGTVFVVDNDAAGKVIAVSILDATGNEFFVVDDEIGKKLFDLVDKNVKATGEVTVDKDGKKRIKIKKFELFAT